MSEWYINLLYLSVAPHRLALYENKDIKSYTVTLYYFKRIYYCYELIFHNFMHKYIKRKKDISLKQA